ncbi:hypothetical protein [Paraclostridium bifermentans]
MCKTCNCGVECTCNNQGTCEACKKASCTCDGAGTCEACNK